MLVISVCIEEGLRPYTITCQEDESLGETAKTALCPSRRARSDSSRDACVFELLPV